MRKSLIILLSFLCLIFAIPSFANNETKKMKYKITEEGRHNIKELSDRHLTQSLLPGEELETMSYVDNNGAIWELSILLSSKKICDMVSFGDDQGNTFHYGFDRLPYYAADFLLSMRNQYTGNNDTYVSFTACWPSYYIYEQIFTYTGELENGNVPVQYRNNAPVPISRLANDPDFTNKFKECSYIGEDPISGTTRFPNWTILENAMSNDGGNKCWIDGVDAMTSVKDNNGSTFTFKEYNESNKTLKCDISLSYNKLSSPNEVITKGINYEGLGRIEGFEAITENFPEFGDIHLFNVGLWDSEAFGNENPFTGSWGPFTAFYLCAGDAHLIWKVDTSAGAFNPEAITREVDVAQADVDTYANSIEGYLFGDPKYARNTSLNPSGDTYTCIYPYTGNNDDVVSPGVSHRLFEGLTPSTFSEWSINDGELPDGITNVWKWNSTYNRMSASGYVNGTNYTTNATLTSPVINLTNATDCILTMNNIVNFGNPDNCKIYVQEIGGSLIALDVQPMPGGSSWESVEGSASLKAFDGKKIQIILSYESTTSEATTWDVYNVYIYGAIKEESEEIFSIIPDLNSFVPRGYNSDTWSYDYGLLMYCHNFPESPYQGSKISWGLSDGFQAELTNTYKKTALISGTGKIIYHYDPNDMSKIRTFSSVGSYVAPPTLYITGAGAFKNGEWNPETPDEFQFINGEYVYEVEELTQFKISIDCGDWDSFNVNSYGCDYGDEPGLTVYLETPWDNNIICPWKGNYKIVVSGDLSTITLTTDTPNPEGPTPIYIRGDMNNWGAVEEWELESISSNIWRFVCNEEQSIPKDWAFKIADADWYKINIGGDGGAIPLENTSEVFNGGYPANLTFSDVFNGVLWLRIDEECLLEASNNKNYIPDWVDCEVPPIPDYSSTWPYLSNPGNECLENAAWVCGILLDEKTFSDLESKGVVVKDLSPNVEDVNFWLWDGTFAAGNDIVGPNGKSGGVVSVTTQNLGWSGAGFDIANPVDLSMISDNTRLHISFCSPDGKMPESIAFVVLDEREDITNDISAKFAVGESFIDNKVEYPSIAPLSSDWLAIDLSMADLKRIYPQFDYKNLSSFSGRIISFLGGCEPDRNIALANIYFYNTLNEVPPLPVEPVASTPVITQDGLFINMTCEDVESKIRYTSDGSTPTEDSTLFTTPIRVKAPRTIKAIAFKDGYQASEIAIKDVKERTVTLASPKIEVSESNEVTITHEYSSATICFTTDGTTPNEESEIYSRSFTQNEGETIKAIAFKGTSDKSSIVTYVPSSPVKPIASTPVITQDGLYFSITCEDAADLYVIQDGKVNTNTSETQGWWNYAWATTEVNGEKVWQFRTADGGAAGSMGFLTGNEQKWLSGKLNGAKLHIEWNYEGAAGATYNVRLTANGANNGGSVEQDQPLPAPAEGWNTTIFDIATDFPNVNNCWKNSEGTGTAFIFSIIANNCSADSRLNIRNVWYSDLNESYAPPVEVELPKPTSVPTYNYAADTQIRYTLDGSEPSQSSMLYTNPFRTALPCTIKAIAFKDGYQASEMAIKDVKERRVTLATPHIHVSLTNEVTISHEDRDVVICYTTDGSTPNEESEIYITPFSITSNQTVKAIAYKGSEEKSLVATTINLSKTTVPEIIFSNGSVTLTHSLTTATLYYAIGSAEDWKVYSGSSFDVSDNRTIYAYAKAPNQADSDVVEYKPDYFVAPVPDMKYDGRYLLLSSMTDCSLRIKSQSSGNYFYPQSGEKIEIKEVGKFELRITAANYNVNTVEFEIGYYFDGERATLAEAGLLEASMEWMTEADKGAVRELTLTGAASVEDFPAICSLGSLETIDMTDLTVAPGTMTGVATDGLKKLRYAILPKEATSIVGAQALVSACPNICAVKWTAPMAVPANFSESFQNKNLLIYLDARAYAPASMPNVIVAGQATDGIILTDGYPFYCPEAFTANRAEITRDFSMTSGMGEAQGWETIALPFSADRFEHESAGSIAPFAAATGEDTPFWLYGLSSGGWEAASEIEANTPYIISMPNNEAYADRFNLNGKVRIYAENVEVPVTQNGESTYGSRHFRTSMMPMEASTALYNLNDATLTGGYRPGSVFIPGLRDVRPLEAYMTTNSPERAIRIFNDFTHVDLLPVFGDDGLTVRSLNGAIIISSMTERDVRVMDAAGAVVASPRLMPGEETRIDSLPHGVYFVGGIKVII